MLENECQRKRHRDIQRFHQGETGAVRETELMICKFFEEVSAFLDDLCCDMLDPGKLNLSKGFSKMDGY